MDAATPSVPTRKQAAVMTLAFGAMCVAFGFSVSSLPGHPITTLHLVSLGCGGIAVTMTAAACILQNLKAR